jgi:iron complex transport system permease protein
MDARKQVPLIVSLSVALVGISALWLMEGLPERGATFVFDLRLTKLVGLIVVGAAIAVSTALFQTLVCNRVLTPSIMGFDALYVLVQTVLVASLGIAGFSAVPALDRFFYSVGSLCGLAILLFGTLLGDGIRDIPRTILTGAVLGVLFRSANSFLTMVLDPDTFSAVQAAQVASFNTVDGVILPWAVVACMVAGLVAFFLAPSLDVLALGRGVAVPLGLRYPYLVVATLAIVAVLVSVSTALVGPITFFGLLVVGITQSLTKTRTHRLFLPLAALVAALVLVSGQFLFERVAGMRSTLAVVIEFFGGLFFIHLLLKERNR